MTALDLHLLPIHRRGGQDQPDLPGLFTAEAPRRAARSRRADIIILHLVLTGTATLPPEAQTDLLESLADDYFASSGAVTTALRATVERLNQFLLDSNLASAGGGLQATGIFTALVLHGGQLYTAQSGPSHIFTIHADRARQLHDPDLTGRGLGISRTPTAHYKNAALHPGDLIVLTPDPPPAWKADSLQKAHGRPIGTIHRVLMNAAGSDVVAVLVQVHAGQGRTRVLERGKLGEEPPPRKPAPPEAAAPPIPPPPPAADAPPRRERPPRAPRPVGPAILAILRAFASALRAIGYSLRAGITRLLPGSELFTLPGTTMAFIAVAVPVVLVTVAGVVYVRRGQGMQFDQYLADARTAAEFAQSQTDPANARIAWDAVVSYLNRAEAIRITEETRNLRIQAYAALDPLEIIERLPFLPALNSPLGETVNIIQMAATRDELYLLDGATGSVIRAWLSGRGYEIDTAFQCGAGSYGSYLVGKLIDIEPMPLNNNLGATIMAMDANGMAALCRPGQPLLAYPLGPPDSNWGSPLAFELDSGALYVLDPQTNAVWIYSGDGYSFVDPPRLFFDDDVPPISDAIDFAVDLDDLYILHADGRITTCIFGFAGQPTSCLTPAPFTDVRAGRPSGAVMENTAFTGLLFIPPPDPSIFLFEPGQAAAYHFSLRLTYQRQFRQLAPTGEAATAFTISPSRMMFLAQGSVVWWAAVP
jgi:hypothetical protein